MSQLLFRIEERLLVESDPNIRAELLARQSGYFARIGRFAEAKKNIGELRKVFSDGRSGRVTAFIMLAEGLVLHYEQLGIGALDRIARAQLIGKAIRDSEVVALSSAWLAHLQFESSKFDLAARSIKLALESAADENHSAGVRCAVVLFNAFALCGERKASQHWFMLGRDHALKDGDQASIDALLHSRAAFGVAWIRSQRCKSAIDVPALSLARAEIASARNLQHLARVEAHSNYIDLCDARLAIVEGRYQSAKELLMLIRNAGPYPDGHFSQSLVDLEIAYCEFKLNHLDLALKAFASVSHASIASLDVDDRLVAAWMVRELVGADSRFGEAAHATDFLIQVESEYDTNLETLRGLFREFAPNEKP